MLLLWPCLCVAQLPVVPFVTQASGFSPVQIPGLALWWHSADTLSQGTGVVLTNWIDEIQGVIWTNGAASGRPTNTAIGVGYGGDGTTASFLTNLSVNIGTNYSVVFVGQITKNSTASGAGGGIYGDRTNLTAGFAFGGTGVSQWDVHNGVNYNIGIAGWPSSNEFDTVLINSNNASIASGGLYGFTNAQLVAEIGSHEVLNTYIAVSGTNFAQSPGPLFFAGYMRDLMVYTNALLTAAQLASIHQWRTNLYGGSP